MWYALHVKFKHFVRELVNYFFLFDKFCILDAALERKQISLCMVRMILTTYNEIWF